MSDPLDGMGLAGWVIGGLASAIGVLVGAIGFQWKNGNDLNKARVVDLTGNATALQNLMKETNGALSAIATATSKRNEVTERLMELITQQGHAFNVFAEQYRIQHVTTEKDLEQALDVINNMSEAQRQTSHDLNAALDAVRSLAESLRVMDRTISDTARVVFENARNANAIILTVNDTNAKVTQLLARKE